MLLSPPGGERCAEVSKASLDILGNVAVAFWSQGAVLPGVSLIVSRSALGAGVLPQHQAQDPSSLILQLVGGEHLPGLPVLLAKDADELWPAPNTCLFLH